ncbi:MAG: NAD(P)/FAD-dependent oxidoreductase [Flavipsychrobacter sp.]
MFSYWEQQSFFDYQHIVVGAGIVGLSTAIELKEKHPHAHVLVLERGLLPTGASTRNAGFACMGSVTELLDDLQHMNEEEVIILYQWRKLGLKLLRKRLGDEHIGYAANGSYELISDAELEALDKIDYLNELLHPVVGEKVFRLANDNITEFGFSKSYTKALIENLCEGELNSGKMMRSLANYAMSKGIEIKTGAEVVRFEEVGHKVTVMVKDPFRSELYPLTCDTLSICTNAFTKKLLPDVDVVPGRGQVLITDLIEGLPFKGVYHFDKGYYYFREIDGRVLLGGGRNLDFKGETSHDFNLSELIQSDLERKLREIILPNTKFQIAQRWAGIMAFGENKYPIVKAFSPRVYSAFRMGGMGVALGSEIARQLVELNEY